MFNQNFFPTPRQVIVRMVSQLNAGTNRYASQFTFLDPSAGKGDILDYLKEMKFIDTKRLLAIEIEPELKSILAAKGYTLIEDDFLDYAGGYHHNVILMNPPFDNGIKHLFHAWKVLPAGGELVCLLNATAVTNDNASSNVLRNLIEDYGRFENIGQPFKQAERKTAVEVVMIYLQKPKAEQTVNFDGSRWERDTAVSEGGEYEANHPAPRAMAESLVAQYKAARDAIMEREELQKKMLFYLKPIASESRTDKLLPKAGINEQLHTLRDMFWSYVFERTDVGRKAPTHFREKFDQFRAEQSNMAFTVSNIYAMFELFAANANDLMEKAIIDVFDQATRYHENNRVYKEGWKTNKSYKVAKKFISPESVRLDIGWQLAYWGQRGFFEDIDRVLCYLTNRDVTQIATVEQTLRDRFDVLNRGGGDYSDPLESEFFMIRFYKKGTVHLTFLDDQVWETFNVAAAKGKNWVGPGY